MIHCVLSIERTNHLLILFHFTVQMLVILFQLLFLTKSNDLRIWLYTEFEKSKFPICSNITFSIFIIILFQQILLCRKIDRFNDYANTSASYTYNNNNIFILNKPLTTDHLKSKLRICAESIHETQNNRLFTVKCSIIFFLLFVSFWLCAL